MVPRSSMALYIGCGARRSTGPFPRRRHRPARGRLSIISIEMIAETVCRKVDVSQSGTIRSSTLMQTLTCLRCSLVLLSLCLPLSACPSRSYSLTQRSQAVALAPIINLSFQPPFRRLPPSLSPRTDLSASLT